MSRSTAVSNAVVESCSGALGSVIALLATYPLKTIYTLQALSTTNAPTTEGTVVNSARIQAVARFLEQYKLSTLYTGLGPNMVESALSSGVYFFFYSKLREQAVAWSKQGGLSPRGAESRSSDIGVLASLLVAAAAGACNQLITMPASVVATRMQGYSSLAGAKSSQRPPTTWETIISVFREGGLAGFWKGLLPSMILLTNPAVQYMLFEKIKALLKTWKLQRLARTKVCRTLTTGPAAVASDGQQQQDHQELVRHCSADSDEAMGAPPLADVQRQATSSSSSSPSHNAAVELSAVELFLAGALAKVGATVVTYPLIVIKARLQASSGSSAAVSNAGAGGGSAAVYRASTWGVMVDTARNEGMGGFFKGLRAKILQTALNAALMLMLKEQLHGVTKSALTCLVPTPASTMVPSAAG